MGSTAKVSISALKVSTFLWSSVEEGWKRQGVKKDLG